MLCSQAVSVQMDFGHAAALQVWSRQLGPHESNITSQDLAAEPLQRSVCASRLQLALGSEATVVQQLPAITVTIELLGQQGDSSTGQERAGTLLTAVSNMLPGFRVQRPEDEADNR